MIFILAILFGRSIPAYAGDPPLASLVDSPLQVYPRLRGGSTSSDDTASTICGLSPPTRGIRLEGIDLLHAGRSIPAYAGDPGVDVGVSLGLAVYPRLRGGSSGAGINLPRANGLSPPTRGIRRSCMEFR